MKGQSRVWVAAGLACACGWGLWLRAQNPPVVRALSSLMPAGALLYLEARDFHALLTQWNNSAEKTKWLASANYDVLSHSRLLGRLQQAQNELEQTSGVSTQMLLLEHTAGKESAFAFYNLGALKFVYITRLESSRIEANELWHTRAQYQPRQASGVNFFVKQDSQTHRTVAMASTNGLFIVATDESLMAATLQLTTQGGASLDTNDWFKNVTANRTQGDLRLAYDLQALEKRPQFRTYWIQGNVTELKEYSAGLSDLFESSSGFQEKRTLLRANANPPPAPGSLALLISAVPSDVSLYRAWANPNDGQLNESIAQVALGQALPGNAQLQYAPVAQSEEQSSGSSDLDTKIDEAAAAQKSSRNIEPVLTALRAMQPTSLLHLQTTAALNDGVFVTPESLVGVACEKPDLQGLQKALDLALGTAMLSGALDPLRVSQNANVLILSRGDLRLERLAQANRNGTAETYAAGYQHQAEWPKYSRLFSVLDAPADNSAGGAPRTSHAFFSDNLKSLGDALSRLQSATLTRTDGGDHIDETVTYQMR